MKRNPKEITPLDMHVSTRLKQLLLDFKIKRSEIASILGISIHQIKKYEEATNKISLNSLYLVGKKVGVEIDYFLRGYNDDYTFESTEGLTLAEKSEKGVSQSELDVLNALYKKITNQESRSKVIEILKLFASEAEKNPGEYK